MRRAALVALALVAFPARGQLLYGPDSPTPIQRPYPSPQVWAPFNVAQCLPTGGIGDVTQGATITTTRASTQTVAVPNTNQTTPGLIPEDAGTVSHVVWNGSALVDTKGNAWTQNGTVPQVPASWYAPPAAGPYSAANNYQGPTTLGEWTGDWSATVVFTPTSTAGYQILVSKLNGTNSSGWEMYLNGDLFTCWLHDGTAKTAIAGSTAVAGAVSVGTCGRSGGIMTARLNDGTASAGTVVGTMIAGAASLRLGRSEAAGAEATTTTIHEVLLSTTPYNDAAVGALQASVLAKIGQGTLSTCPAASLAVGVQGAEIYAAGTNYALQSQTSCVGNAVQAPWALAGVPTCVSDAGVAPDGTATMDEWTASGSTNLIYQGAPTLPLRTTITASVWASKASGTGPAGIWAQGGGACGSVTACVCGTSDGSACTPTISGVNCQAQATVGMTPIRIWASATCASATVSGTIVLVPGDYGVSTGTTRFWGAQVEPGLYPTPYVPTTTATASRAATVSTVPLPALHTTNTWCIGVTATPGPGQPWGQLKYLGIVAAGANNAANSFKLAGVTSGQIGFFLFDGTGTSRSAAFTTSWSAGTTHRLVACSASGILSVYGDGMVLTGANGGTGTGLLGSTPAALTIGDLVGSGYSFDGSLRDLRIYPNATYKAGM